MLVADHRTPPHRYPGPFADPANLWTLCKACNNSKGDRTVEEWQGRTEQPAGRPLYIARSYLSSEAEAARELGRIRQQVEAWRRADKRAWPAVGGRPAHHHGRWSPRCTVALGHVTWDVCPPGCASPVRLQEPPGGWQQPR